MWSGFVVVTILQFTAGMDTMGGGAPPPDPPPDDEMTMTKFGRLSLANFTTCPLKKKRKDFWPPYIHLCVQHIPLINLMGFMTFFSFEILDQFRPLRQKIGSFGAKMYPLPSEEQRCLVIVISSSRAP